MDCSTPGLPAITNSWTPNPCPLSRWCHPTISSSVCFSRLQSFSASGSFQMSQFFASGGQSIGASASVLPMNVPGLISFRIDWFDLPCSPGGFQASSQAPHNSKASIRRCSAAFIVQLSHLYMTAEKNIALAIWTFVTKWYLCFLIYCLGLS